MLILKYFFLIFLYGSLCNNTKEKEEIGVEKKEKKWYGSKM